MTAIEAMKQALEALEQILKTLDDENTKPGGAVADTIWYSEHETLFDYVESEIASLRQAINEAEKQIIKSYLEKDNLEQEPLFKPLIDLHPGLADELKAIGEQEPRAEWVDEELRNGPYSSRNYKNNKSEWVDLTDDEMLMIYGQHHEGKKYSLGRMVQQALKEKNT